jgi:N-acetylglutamate synthase-like GNAT family acetyltransferase
MIVRNATSEDIPAIVVLLQQSLGEGLLKKSEDTWNFKHNKNPFGISYVLLAFVGEELVGVRAFMKWKWQFGTQYWTAYRAVDTATHPDYQGKGIFKKLTLQALDDIQKEDETFVFNTPNNNSRPGYLKMGWKIVDKIELAVVPTPFYIFQFFFNKANFQKAITNTQLDLICNDYNSQLSKKNLLFTPKSAAYLRWRYEENPLQDYVVFSSTEWYLAFYVKKHRFFNELRVVESISSDLNRCRKQMQHAILRFAFQNKCGLITTSNKDLFRCKIYGKFGPKLTIRTLTKDSFFTNSVYTIKRWYYSLGDLELF